MNGAIDISVISLASGFLLLLIPFLFSYIFKLGIIRATLISAGRMTLQLVLMGIFLQYLFDWNNAVLNIVWLFMMIFVATFSVIRNSDLNLKIFLMPLLSSFTISVFTVVLYFNTMIVGLNNVLTAKYLIIIGGMLLGNSLRGNIIGLTTFYKDINRNKNRFQYSLSMGATLYEAVIPFIREALRSALKPSIANMATFGIVSLPGMMTGQILGGSAPITAIKYQIAIVIAIFASVAVTVTLSILITLNRSFDSFGNPKENIIKT